jgi:uncharacterized membrane protein YdcZ (DUF606 family)
VRVEVLRQRLNLHQEPVEEYERQVRVGGLIENYRTILNELALLTTVSVLLFGFLLASTSSVNSGIEEWLNAIAICLVATSTMVFTLPVAYHHLQFPYQDFEKFQARTHNWMRIGLPLLGGSLYLSLCLAIWSLFGEAAFLIAGLPILVTLLAFFLRKR